MTTPSDLHAWFLRRLPAFVGGLLAEEEERRFVEHRAGCESCRAAFDAFTASDEFALTERGAHVPAAMLARWPEARRELRGIERSMVRAHLERCDVCRADLERTGQAPVLEFVAELESAPDVGGWRAWLFGRDRGASSAARGPTDSGAFRVASSEAHPLLRRGWVRWALGGWAAAATVALVVLVLQPAHTPLGSGDLTASLPKAHAPPAGVPAADPALRVLPPVRALTGATRGSAPPPDPVTLDPTGRFAHVSLPDLFLPDSTTLVLELTGPNGQSSWTERRSYGEIAPPRTLLIGRAESPLERAPHRLTVRLAFGRRALLAEFRLQPVR